MRLQNRRRMIATLVRWACFAALTALLVVHVVRRGPLTLHSPATVISNSHPIQRVSEPYLLFVREIARSMPGGATVVVVGREEVDFVGYIALGQLPNQTLLPPASLHPSPEGRRTLPEFVASYGAPFRDERYRLRGRFPAGNLYERTR